MYILLFLNNLNFWNSFRNSFYFQPVCCNHWPFPLQICAPFWCPTKLEVSTLVQKSSTVIYDAPPKTEMFEFPLPEAESKFNFCNSAGFRYEAKCVRICLMKGTVDCYFVKYITWAQFHIDIGLKYCLANSSTKQNFAENLSRAICIMLTNWLVTYFCRT